MHKQWANQMSQKSVKKPKYQCKLHCWLDIIYGLFTSLLIKQTLQHECADVLIYMWSISIHKIYTYYVSCVLWYIHIKNTVWPKSVIHACNLSFINENNWGSGQVEINMIVAPGNNTYSINAIY